MPPLEQAYCSPQRRAEGRPPYLIGGNVTRYRLPRGTTTVS